jgi:hypothetical protein
MDGERDDRRSTPGRRDGDGKYDPARDARRDSHVAEISARLRHPCQHLTDAEFTRLVLDMAETRLRFAEIDRDMLSRGIHILTDTPTKRDAA